MPSLVPHGGTLSPAFNPAGTSEVAVVVGSLILLASAVLLCVKKKKSNNSRARAPSLKQNKGGSWKAAPSERIALLETQVEELEAENAALRQNADTKLQLEVRPPTSCSFFCYSRTLMGCADPLRPSVPSRFGSNLPTPHLC